MPHHALTCLSKYGAAVMVVAVVLAEDVVGATSVAVLGGPKCGGFALVVRRRRFTSGIAAAAGSDALTRRVVDAARAMSALSCSNSAALKTQRALASLILFAKLKPGLPSASAGVEPCLAVKAWNSRK